ncbi:hypothetical protein QUF54_00180 [Candidatus Marithioploca araucensis]|uniref:Uncharacterized protein n=1 Tax=Candidatus Marithioploca araucensis TaxID=70273 RepID=A0ABT7VQ18_9GAMM|nr:hypothetical protein [Candidatus Marithioploca araucensis]
MTTAIENQDGELVKQRYLTRVNQLYSDITCWLKDQKELHLEQHAVEIGEDLTGFYTAPTLVVSSPNEWLAEFKPEGACIIEAEGRIDLLALLGIEYIIYMVNGGPILGGQKMFKDIDADGWYWTENNLKNKAHFMNQENFLKLFKQVTEYGI